MILAYKVVRQNNYSLTIDQNGPQIAGLSCRMMHPFMKLDSPIGSNQISGCLDSESGQLACLI